MKTQITWSRETGKAVYARTQATPNFSGTIPISVSGFAALSVDQFTASFWRQVHYIFCQLDGMVEGYNKAMPANVRFSLAAAFVALIYDFFFIIATVIYGYLLVRSLVQDESPLRPLLFSLSRMNAAGDLEDLVGYFSADLPVDQQPPLAVSKRHRVQTGLDCSAFVKPVSKQVGGPFHDIVFGHTTWSEFYSMNRIYKQYNLTFSDPWVKSDWVAFSSRPAFISSKDDFYINAASGFSRITACAPDLFLFLSAAASALKKQRTLCLIAPYTTCFWFLISLSSASSAPLSPTVSPTRARTGLVTLAYTTVGPTTINGWLLILSVSFQEHAPFNQDCCGSSSKSPALLNRPMSPPYWLGRDTGQATMSHISRIFTQSRATTAPVVRNLFCVLVSCSHRFFCLCSSR